MKICFKTNIKILTEPPKVPYSSLKYTAFTKALLYANTKIAFSKIKTIELSERNIENLWNLGPGEQFLDLRVNALSIKEQFKYFHHQEN